MQGNVIIRINAVKAKTGLSRTSIYALMKRREFPASISLGPRCVGWVDDEVNNWIGERIKASRAKAGKV